MARIDDVQKLAELLTTRDREDPNKAPDYADPMRYTRHIQIEDPEAIEAITRLDQHIASMRALARKMEIIDAKMTIDRSELYDRLESVYPTILVTRRGGSGLRDWQGAWWYVGWDHSRYQGENNDGRPGDGRGTYI